jgi:hypothetical protein
MSDSETLIKRLRALAVRDGLSLGVMASNKPADFTLVLAAAGCAFAAGDALSEREVNARLIAWREGAGAMLAVDHVELRRWLVDNSVLARDGYGRVYTRGTPRDDIAAAMTALAGHDLTAIVRNARALHFIRRAARRAQWTKAPHATP